MVDISQNGQKLLFKLTTVGVIKICALVFHELLSQECINLENLCAHHQEDLLTIPKHPQHCHFGIVITWLKIIQTLQVGGVLETSGPTLDDGHRDFEDRCILGNLRHAF